MDDMGFKKIEDETTCNICLKSNCELTFEHVPPKSVQRWRKLRILQNFSGSVLYLREKPPGFIKDVEGGLAFKTTCAQCNNSLLASYDSEYAKLYLLMENRAKIAMQGLVTPDLEIVNYSCDLGKVLRSVLGHTLASYIVTPDWPFADKVRKFVQDPQSNLPSDIYVYYWFYRAYDIKIGNGFGFMFELDTSNQAFIHSFIKSWPLSFLISTEKLNILHALPGVFTNKDLISTDGKFNQYFSMNFKDLIHPEWPEGGNGKDLSGIMLFNDEMSINIRATSLLKKQSIVRKIKRSKL